MSTVNRSLNGPFGSFSKAKALFWSWNQRELIIHLMHCWIWGSFFFFNCRKSCWTILVVLFIKARDLFFLLFSSWSSFLFYLTAFKTDKNQQGSLLKTEWIKCYLSKKWLSQMFSEFNSKTLNFSNGRNYCSNKKPQKLKQHLNNCIAYSENFASFSLTSWLFFVHL